MYMGIYSKNKIRSLGEHNVLEYNSVYVFHRSEDIISGLIRELKFNINCMSIVDVFTK